MFRECEYHANLSEESFFWLLLQRFRVVVGWKTTRQEKGKLATGEKWWSQIQKYCSFQLGQPDGVWRKQPLLRDKSKFECVRGTEQPSRSASKTLAIFDENYRRKFQDVRRNGPINCNTRRKLLDKQIRSNHNTELPNDSNRVITSVDVLVVNIKFQYSLCSGVAGSTKFALDPPTHLYKRS